MLIPGDPSSDHAREGWQRVAQCKSAPHGEGKRLPRMVPAVPKTPRVGTPLLQDLWCGVAYRTRIPPTSLQHFAVAGGWCTGRCFQAVLGHPEPAAEPWAGQDAGAVFPRAATTPHVLGRGRAARQEEKGPFVLLGGSFGLVLPAASPGVLSHRFPASQLSWERPGQIRAPSLHV